MVEQTGRAAPDHHLRHRGVMDSVAEKMFATPRMPTSPEWGVHSQSLKCILGDYCLWQFFFEAKVADTPLTCYLDNEKLLQGVMATVGETQMPYVIRSFPAPSPLPRLAVVGKHLRYVPVQYPRYYVEFKGSFEEYLKRFSPKSRYNLARSVRKLAEFDGGRIDWREYRQPEEMAEFHLLADALSKRTYQEKVLHEGFASRAGSPENLRMLAQTGAVRGYILFAAGQAIAYVFCRCCLDTLLYDAIGYDPLLHKYSPGSVLLYVLIEKMFAEQAFKYLDFGEGGSWYKEHWSTGAARCARAYYFPMAVPIVSAVMMHMTANAISDLLGKGLQTVGLRDKLRRLLRNRVLSDANE
jgi:Acetyltransferase (GNAT) domain